MMPADYTQVETFGKLLGLGQVWRVVEARFESSSSTFVLKVEGMRESNLSITSKSKSSKT